MAQSQTVLRRKDTTSNSALYISFDLGDKSWQISLGDDRFHVSRHTVAAGDTAGVDVDRRRSREPRSDAKGHLGGEKGLTSPSS